MGHELEIAPPPFTRAAEALTMLEDRMGEVLPRAVVFDVDGTLALRGDAPGVRPAVAKPT